MPERLTPGSAALPAVVPWEWKAWWLHLYHTDRFSFTVVTLLVILLAGAVLGLLTDALLKRLGIDLNSRMRGEQ